MAFASEEDIKRRAGTGRNFSGALTADLDDYMNYAIARINVETGWDWVANSGALSDNTKGILRGAEADKAAMKVINHDMSGYTSRAEAQTMLDVLRDDYNDAIKLLREKEKAKFVDDTSTGSI